ncbi:MAG: hypothetical protein IT342_01740 [Candidatus Melainabacteria bacterium]|nr:hypothetical protein [Candidatus Melainabacteria bacterium]
MRLRSSILAAVIAVSAVARSASGADAPAANVSAPQSNLDPSAQANNKIEAAIRKLGVLAPDSKLSVQIADKQALVTVYGDDRENAAAGLLKIDAVLIAKCVFDNVQDAVRTRVCFGTLKVGSPRAGYLSQVSVSKGDIKAFGSNQLTKADLLASLEIVETRQTGFPSNIARVASKTSVQSQDPVEILNAASPSKFRWVPYRNTRTGLTLSYPFHWKLKEAPEKDTLFKIDSQNCELVFGVDNSPGMPVRQAARLWENLVFSQFKDYKLISSRRIKLGHNNSLDGYSFVIQFSAGDVPFQQRWVFFGQTGSVYRAILSMPERASKANLPDMYRILTSITFTGGTITARKPAESQAVKPWSRLSLFQDGPVCLTYPADWQVTQHPEPEVIVKISGKTAEGDADLQIRKSPSDRNMSLEDIATLVETRYLKPLKNYRRARQEYVSLGGGAAGMLQEFTFELGGIPFRQMSTYRLEGDHLYTMSLVASGWKQSDMLTLFNRCLGTWSVRE